MTLGHKIKIKMITILITFLFTLIGCGERSADIKHPKSYFKNGLKFSYPGNWTITSDEGPASFRSITVETPGEAIVIIQIYDASEVTSLREYALKITRGVVGGKACRPLSQRKLC